MSTKKARNGKAPDLEDSLCCCEYIDRDGEKNHMVACFCDCEDLDHTCDRWITCKPLKPETLQRTFETILDRFRIPWISGARKIDISLVPPLVLLPAFLHVAALHYLLTIIILTSLPVVVLWYYYLTHRNKGRTLFFLSLGLFSLGYMYYTFLQEVVPRGHVGLSQVFIITCGVLLMLGALTQAKKDPGYLCSKAEIVRSPTKGSPESASRRTVRSNGFHKSLSGSDGKHAADNDAVGCARLLSENPGVAEKDWCTICKLVKPARAGHCRICSACVSRLDHHCVWINNCIGESNHRSFLCVIFLFLLTAIYGITLTLNSICRRQSVFLALLYCPGVYADYGLSEYQMILELSRKKQLNNYALPWPTLVHGTVRSSQPVWPTSL
ncbi:palmitoyltransferase ZDHHC23 isoform X2 [Ambystoma mexicanum]|uniref:palmitoyltransferase ZDHHC23 isoform X2 n=1 Tax=Ambystoma mexicanum TaxID=8296 RepID=UPI0037E8EE4A